MHDIYTDVTQRIITALEAGTPPWVRPWSSVPDATPTNAHSHRPYRGVNVLLLELQATARGYPLQRWLTYRQAAELGGQVRRGEHGTTVVFWQLRKLDAQGDESLPSERVVPLLRAYTVFNVAQIDGLPEVLCAAKPVVWEPTARAEALLLASAATIHHGGSRAYYQPDGDLIQLPPRSAFPTAATYYATALHELTHWSGHPSRCNRQFGQRFGDDAYAAEELVAEVGAAFLCAHCRIDGQLQHASYLSSWLRILRADKRAIFVAATKAQQAADFVLARGTANSDASVLAAA